MLKKVFGYIPVTLKIDEDTLKGRFWAYRICNGLTYGILATKIGLDKSTLSRFEKEGSIKKETLKKIKCF